MDPMPLGRLPSGPVNREGQVLRAEAGESHSETGGGGGGVRGEAHAAATEATVRPSGPSPGGTG